MENKEFDRISYALGLSMGNSFRSSGIEKIDFKDFADGVAAVYSGATPRMSYDEAKEEIRRYFTAMEERQQAEAAEKGKINRQAGEAFLAENAKRPEVKVTPSGLQYEVIEEGDGPTPTAQDSVTVHYTGKLINGTVFDSSVDRGEPADFPVSQVIPGFAEGLKMMNKGSKYVLYIPASLGYGNNEAGNIPAGSTLVFEVEMIEVN